MKMTTANVTFSVGLWIGLAFGAMAEKLPVPNTNPILTVSGAVSNTNVKNNSVFDYELLRSLPVTSIETGSIWYDGTAIFEGVSLVDFLAEIGAEGSVLEVTALNEYTIEIPVSDAVIDGPILAYLMNGEQMPVRGKGPLWIIYPYDQNIRYRSEVYYARSIWQVSRINIRD